MIFRSRRGFASISRCRAVVLENDADSAGLAEARFGAGVGHSPLLYMNVGSGIGGALVVDQQIYRGSGQGAIEIGHLRVPDSHGRRELGTVELEQVASGWAIASAARELGRRKIQEGRGDWLVLTRAQGNPEPDHRGPRRRGRARRRP